MKLILESGKEVELLRQSNDPAVWIGVDNVDEYWLEVTFNVRLHPENLHPEFQEKLTRSESLCQSAQSQPPYAV